MHPDSNAPAACCIPIPLHPFLPPPPKASTDVHETPLFARQFDAAFLFTLV